MVRPEFELKSSQFRREREASWQELERAIRKLEDGGVGRLSADELSRLPVLYRSAVSSLSVARAISLDRNLLDYLENLVGRAFLNVYGTRRSPLEALRSFCLARFPGAVRRHAAHVAASVALLLAGVLAGWLLTLDDVERYYGIVPVAMQEGRTPEATTAELREILYHEGLSGEEGEARLERSLELFASFLFTHNAKIGILSFAIGFAAAAPTVFLLVFNGLALGSLGALYQQRGLGPEFWAWVLPHGVTELFAVALCGAAGLAIGLALVFPGRHGRLRSLARRGREVAPVVLGAVLMFLVAALIEGFFRQLVQSEPVRWSVAAGTALFWLFYFIRFGRDDAAERTD